ncbi:hypothetical protein [Streptomyces sp. NPDC048473]|uniref:hypothetical protein n=1 Tax=unclassified Streptomyces TaxID=2593676 RepID=UPI0037160348
MHELVILGLAGTAGRVALMALIGSRTDLWWMRLLMLGMGLAMGRVVVSTRAATLVAISPADAGHASPNSPPTRSCSAVSKPICCP